MTTQPEGTIRSFIIILYNGSLTQCGYFSLPLSVAAPFTNRLFQEALPQQKKSVKEPWYSLRPHVANEPLLQRAATPEGPTSLYGQRYFVAEEPPPRVSLHPEAQIRYFTVCLFDFQTELYRGDYSVDDIFLAGAEYLARAWIEKGNMDAGEGPFYYAVFTSPNEVLNMNPDLFPREAYQVEGVFQLPQLAPNRKRTKFTRVKPDPLPERDPTRYDRTRTRGRGRQMDNLIFMRADIYQALQTEIELSDKVEDGGYLLGRPYRLPGSPPDETDDGFRWLVELTDIVQAQGAWGSPGLLLFTGESWSQITRRRDQDYPDKKIVAWFHTHLFAATDEFGLSGLDQDLHRRFLTKPWQIAVLLNINARGEREIRCFQRGPEGDLVECNFEIFEARVEDPT